MASILLFYFVVTVIWASSLATNHSFAPSVEHLITEHPSTLLSAEVYRDTVSLVTIRSRCGVSTARWHGHVSGASVVGALHPHCSDEAILRGAKGGGVTTDV